jgi:hypothetical protein
MDMAKELEEVVEWQKKYGGMQDMCIYVLEWLVAHKDAMPQAVAAELSTHIVAKLVTEKAKHPTVDGLPDLKVT